MIPPFIRLLVFATAGLALLPPSHLCAASAQDLAVLKKLLTSAEVGGDRTNLTGEWEGQVKAIADPELQGKARALLPELAGASALHTRVQAVVAKTAEAKGTARLENGGPAWLRELVGDDAMHLFDRLTSVSLYDGQNPHDKSYRRNESLNDDWLSNLINLPDLTSLDLANTSVKGSGLPMVGKLTTLESLNLTLTPITDDFLEPLGALTKLRSLSLASAQCSGTGFRFFGKLKELQNANFHFTPVNDAGLAGISTVTSLTRLEIVHTHFTDAGTPALAKLINLERLQIGSREATGAAVAPLVALKKLRELDLHDGQATLEGLQHAALIPSLTVLRVYGSIKDEGAQLIGQMKNLETLIAPGTGITDAGLEQLAGLAKLKKIDLKGCKVSEAALAKLKAAVPGLEVAQ